MTERSVSPADRTGSSRGKRGPSERRKGDSDETSALDEPSEVLSDPDQGTTGPTSPSPASTTSAAEAQSGAGPGWEEEFLREIDRIQGDLASQTPTAAARAARRPAGTQPDWREDLPPGSDGESRWGARSPYLEERLRLARGAASRLTTAARTMEQSVSTIRENLETIDQELARAREELNFERSGASSDSPETEFDPSKEPPSVHPAAPAQGPKPIPAVSPTRKPREDSRRALTGSFPDFTVSRYNETVSSLHARRKSIAWGTVVAATGISALLLVLTLRANEPLPVIWLAVLPLVWMVPVPFFMAAFRGTQRVLRQNRLELPEER